MRGSVAALSRLLTVSACLLACARAASASPPALPLALLPPAGSLPGEIARAALVGLAFLTIFVAAEVWRRKFSPPVEWTRKLVHFCGGLVCLSFPWMFHSIWTVVALGALFAGAIALGRRIGLLHSVTAVERRTRGEVWFPVAVVALFAVARHRPVFYMIALATLVFADALAAVLGKAYGRHEYVVQADRKTLEGSAVFLLTTFLVVHLPLLLMTDIDRGTSVIVALQMALLVGSFEAISMGGSDNLVVPLAAYYLLLKLTPAAASATSLQLAAQLTILGTMLLFARRTRFLTFSGAIAAHLMLYAAFSLGGPAWMVAPALALAGFVALDTGQSRATHLQRGGYQVAAIFYVSIVAVLLIFADNTFATLVRASGGLGIGHPFHAPFVGALAASLAIVADEMFESLPRFRHRPVVLRALVAGGFGFGLVTPLSLWALNGEVTQEGLVVAAATTALALPFHRIARRLGRPRPGSLRDLRLQALSVLLVTLVVLPFHFARLGITSWGARP